MRQLTEEEKRICRSSIKRINEEISENEITLNYTKLMKKRQINEYDKAIKQFEEDIELKKGTIKTLNDQIRNGVNQKEVKEEDGGDKTNKS